MIKKLFLTTQLLFCCFVLHSYARNEYASDSDRDLKRRNKMVKEAALLPDSAFEYVKMEDLLDDQVYMKLAHDGWSPQEIVTIMKTALKDRKAAKNKFGYGWYAKQWLPTYGIMPGGDTLYQFVDTTYNEVMQASIARTVPTDVLNHTWPKIVYTPEDRKKGIRNTAYFRTVEHKPSSGRMHWGVVHPEDHDKLYVIPDGAGIFKTDNGGLTWTCITDNIPVRAHRSTVRHSSIPVDPDDWNHLFAFGDNSTVYETTDGGDSWRRIEGATHKGYKRGYAFRDKAGNLKFIGAQQQGGIEHWASKLWISEDTCKTWTEVIVPDELKDVHPNGVGKGVWFQSVEFDPSNRDMIYIPGSRSIFYFDDGAKSTVENGKRKYNIKKMSFDVYNENRTALRNDPSDPDNKTIFPLRATSPGNMVISTINPNQMWFAAAVRNGNATALYYTEDKGKTWITLQEPSAGIGGGTVFGNEAPWNWLGGFGVNLRDPNWVYGCTMSSAISSDGGKNFDQFAWSIRLTSLQEDGKYYAVTNSRHNADNHFILSHKSGRVFRGSDGGMLMKDLDVNNNQWTNIGGNMGQMLYYNIRVNEFGDQLMVGNTQDIDVQTYRYGRWGNWRGYEGSESSANPYTSTCYFSGGGGGGIENMPLDSWSTTTNYADVHTGSWYMRRTGTGKGNTFYRIDDIGRSLTNLFDNVGADVADVTFARDKGYTTIFVRTTDNILKKSIDSGNSFQDILYNGEPAKFSNTRLAADPDNSDILYLGQTGQVMRLYVNESRWEKVGEGLPNIACDHLFFHEGSGDLYFVNRGSAGIYILENGSNTWRFWTKGYNSGKFSDIVMNYTTQEMVLADYGRGVWVADLEHPSDRFFKNGFALKEITHVDGRRTIGIDTKWTIPLYYYYEWTVNGMKVDNPYQYLTQALRPGDKVQLKLTLRESPDVSTLSAEYIVKETPDVKLEKKAGNALYSNGKGRIDLGYVDYFFNDFTVDLWVKPMNDGVLLANRQKEYDKGAKGWLLFVENGTLKFRYSPSNQFNKPTYEPASDEQKTIEGGKLNMGEWAHVAITEKRDGSIRLYVNGMLTGEGERYRREHTLNNSTYLSLFADAFEYAPIEAAVDELKIWNYELNEEEIRREMYSVNVDNRNGLVAYYAFNGDNLSGDLETFAGYQPRVMTRAEVTHEKMSLPISAQRAAYGVLTDGEKLFEDRGVNLLKIAVKNTTSDYQIGVYAYKAEHWLEDKSNLDTKYYEVEPTGYIFRNFTVAEADTLTLDFYAVEGKPFNQNKRYRLYYSEDGRRNYWNLVGDLTYNADTQTLQATDLPMQELQGKKMLVVSLKPAIEMTVEGVSNRGELTVYSEDQHTVKAHASIVEGLAEPNGVYDIVSDNDVLQPQTGFYFTKGEASSDLKIGQNLGAFNERNLVTLKGKTDEKMIPMPIEVVNRITPKGLGNSTWVEKGGILVGSADNYVALHESNTVTIMGWVYLGDVDILSGTKPLLFFRSSNPSVATGLHLQNGNVRCHWNEESWSWNQSTSLNVAKDQVGQWIHLALVARPDGMDYYLNGMKYSIKRNINKGRIHSMLMLGQNQMGNTWFTGAFDQVAVWNRSLTQEEVLRYMQERVLLNDSALVAYLTMDVRDENGDLRESVQDMSLKHYGTLTQNYRSTVPFNPESRLHLNQMSETSAVQLIYPEGKNVLGEWNTFDGTSYNYVAAGRQSDLPLSKTHYTLVYANDPQLTATDRITLRYRHAGIMEQDHLVMAIRALGSESPFEHFVEAQTVENGKAEFSIEGALLNRASEVMFFVSPESGKRPVKVELALADGMSGNSNIMLEETAKGLPLQVKVLSGNADDVVMLEVKETAYASLDKDSVDMRNGDNRFTIMIDQSKLDKMALNPITVQAVGVESAPLEFKVYLEPKVELKLKNGTDDYTFVATAPTADLEVEAELLQGYLEEEVQLTTITDVDNAMNIGNGTLLSNSSVTIGHLEHFESPYGKAQEGWNLIGNPYLADINITKHQNVIFDEHKVTKFVYQYNKELDNYITFDMTNYDEEQKIIPFQSYFVQTLAPEAELTVTPVAKEVTLNRRTFDYYTANEYTSVRLKLYAEDKEQDRTDIIWEEGASADFVVNEDAPKFWSLSATANQLFSAAGESAASVNTLPMDTEEVKLGLRIGTPGKLSLRLSRITGFTGDDEVILWDKHTGAEWKLDQENAYEFDITQTGDVKDRFVLKVKRHDTSVGVEDRVETAGYKVYVSGTTCMIENLRGNADIQIFNVQGQLVARDKTAQHNYSVSLKPGIHVVKISENGKDYVTKIILK